MGFDSGWRSEALHIALEKRKCDPASSQYEIVALIRSALPSAPRGIEYLASEIRLWEHSGVLPRGTRNTHFRSKTVPNG